MFGRTHKATPAQAMRRYYLCHGKDCILSAREQACPRRAIKAEELERAVWTHVAQLLSDPRQLLAQFRQFASVTGEGDEEEQAETQRLAARIERLGREESRLIDAYQGEVITLPELAQRRHQLAQRRQALIEQQAQQARLRQQRVHAQEVLEDLTTFCERIRTRLAEATFADQQAILQLLIERIIVGEDTLEIRHVIPLRGLPPTPGDSESFNLPLRSDGASHCQCA
jgi:site-specific DNA recombinase